MCFTNPNKIPQCHHRDTCSWGSGRRPLAAGLARLRDTIHGQRHAVGLPALRRERLRVEAGVLQMRKVCSKSWGLYPSPAPYEWHWCQWWCGSRVVWGGSPPPVICSTTTTTHTQHTQIHRFQTGGSRSFWCAIDFCVWVGSVTVSDPVDWVTVTKLCCNLCQLRVLCSYTSIHRYIHIVIICRLSLHCFIYYNVYQSVSYPMFSIQVLFNYLIRGLAILIDIRGFFI